MRSTASRIVALALLASSLAGLAAVPPAPTPAAIPPIPTGPATIVVGAPAPQGCSCSLCSFLGLDKMAGGIGKGIDCIRNSLGSRYPGLEATPAMTAIADPANLKSPNPAVATAADIKAQEDAAPQKIKALHYLATVGCIACYPDVEKAFLAGLDDCTEVVRFEAAQTLRNMEGCPCKSCQAKSCCTAAIRKKLKDLACGVNEKTGCWKEPSARVRRVARLALEKCGCPLPPETPHPGHQQGPSQEGPGARDLPAPPATAPTPAPTGPAPSAPAAPAPATPPPAA